MNGRLEIKSDSPSFLGSTIKIDGKEFPVTDIEISGFVDGVWTVQATFYIKGLDVDLVADIKAKFEGEKQ